MDARANELLSKITTHFPESDASVLTALLEKTDATARYLAQVHDLTLSEATEGLEWALAARPAVLATQFAAE